MPDDSTKDKLQGYLKSEVFVKDMLKIF